MCFGFVFRIGWVCSKNIKRKYQSKNNREHKHGNVLIWFSDENGNRSTELTDSHWDIKFKKENDQTLMEITITHDKFEDIETIIEMGFKEGITQCFEQLDELLEDIKKIRKISWRRGIKPSGKASNRKRAST